jgi:hypothetical protein
MRDAQSLLAEFGMSPASRAKVSVASGKAEADDPWRLIAGSR